MADNELEQLKQLKQKLVNKLDDDRTYYIQYTRENDAIGQKRIAVLSELIDEITKKPAHELPFSFTDQDGCKDKTYIRADKKWKNICVEKQQLLMETYHPGTIVVEYAGNNISCDCRHMILTMIAAWIPIYATPRIPVIGKRRPGMITEQTTYPVMLYAPGSSHKRQTIPEDVINKINQHLRVFFPCWLGIAGNCIEEDY